MTDGGRITSDVDGDSLESTILALVRTKLGHDVQLADSLALLNVDSVGIAELSIEIEQAVGVRMDEGIIDVDSVGQLVEYVRELMHKVGRTAG